MNNHQTHTQPFYGHRRQLKSVGCWLPVLIWSILLEQKFTGCMPLLMTVKEFSRRSELMDQKRTRPMCDFSLVALSLLLCLDKENKLLFIFNVLFIIQTMVSKHWSTLTLIK